MRGFNWHIELYFCSGFKNPWFFFSPPKLKSVQKLQNEQRLQLSCVEILSSDAFLLMLLGFYRLLRLNFWLGLKKSSEYKSVDWRACYAELGALGSRAACLQSLVQCVLGTVTLLWACIRSGWSQSDPRSLLSSTLSQASLRMLSWTVGMGKACVDPAGEYSQSHLQFVAQDLPEPSAISVWFKSRKRKLANAAVRM